MLIVESSLLLASCKVLPKFEEFRIDDVSESVSREANKYIASWGALRSYYTNNMDKFTIHFLLFLFGGGENLLSFPPLYLHI